MRAVLMPGRMATGGGQATVDDTAPTTLPVRVGLEVMRPFTERIAAGAVLSLRVALIHAADVDPCGARFEVRNKSGCIVGTSTIAQIEQVCPDSYEYDPRRGQVDTRPFMRVAVKVPERIGEHRLTIVLPQQSLAHCALFRSEATFAFSTIAHTISLAIWDIRSPLVAGQPFHIRVGAKCSGGCCLAGLGVRLHDELGQVTGEAWLQEPPLAGTDGLYWSELRSVAPPRPGFHRWSVRCGKVALPLPHQTLPAAACGFLSVPRPDHWLKIRVIDRDTRQPVEGAYIRLGAYRAGTDAAGEARLHIALGTYHLSVWKEGVHALDREVEVAQDHDLVIEAEVFPTPDPYMVHYRDANCAGG